MRVRKRYLLVSLLTIVLTLSIVVSAVCVFAALSQQVSLNTTISVEAINAVWTDGNQSEVSQLDFPTYVAPGQSISPEGGLFVKNEGVVAYARFKPTVKLNDVESDLVQLTINTDWIYEESDGYYYYCGASSNGTIGFNEFALVVEDIIVSDTFTNKNSGDNIKISFLVELLEKEDNSWKTEWGTNLPDQWFLVTGQSVLLTDNSF